MIVWLHAYLDVYMLDSESRHQILITYIFLSPTCLWREWRRKGGMDWELYFKRKNVISSILKQEAWHFSIYHLKKNQPKLEFTLDIALKKTHLR